MSSGSWMLRQLDYVTRAHHVQADAARIALFQRGVTREKYVEFLARVYAFEAPIEARWKQMPDLMRVVHVEPRIRTGYLLSDLRALGVVPDLLMPPSFVGVEQALGWMYVVERGRRLNAMLHRHLSVRLPAEAMLGGNYLLASSTAAGNRWEELGLALDEYTHTAVMTDQVINAAMRAFKALRAMPAVALAHAA